MGAGEAGDMDIDQGPHKLIGKAFCKSSLGAYAIVTESPKWHITKKLENLHAESFSCHQWLWKR